jgi:hypothetical protein
MEQSKMNHYFRLHHHPSLFLLTLEAEAPQATTSSTAAVEESWVEREIISDQGAPSNI